MMKVSTRGRYALRLMLDLAENGRGDYVSLKDISQRQSISMKYLEQIVTQLSNSGLIKSKRGPQGGFCRYCASCYRGQSCSYFLR